MKKITACTSKEEKTLNKNQNDQRSEQKMDLASQGEKLFQTKGCIACHYPMPNQIEYIKKVSEKN